MSQPAPLKIDIHTHILPENWPDLKERYGYGGFIKLESCGPGCANMLRDDGHFFRKVDANCWDPHVRMNECDHHGVDVQVLSTVPVMFSYWARPEDTLDLSKLLNDHIASVVADNPKRFVGLGTVPMQNTKLAIQELERCVKELKFPGVQIGTHVEGMNLDDPRLFPFFEAAADLNACIFIHPWDVLGDDRMKKYWMPWLIGMPTESAVAAASLIFGKVLERLPNLRIAFAHGGGAAPALIGRLEHGHYCRPDLFADSIENTPRDFLKKLYFDTLVHDPAVLKMLMELVGPEKLAVGSDYPFPLGELDDIGNKPHIYPGHLVEELQLDPQTRDRMLHGTALEWLNMEKEVFL